MQRTRCLLRCIRHAVQLDAARLVHRKPARRGVATSAVCCHLLDARGDDVAKKEQELTVRKGKVFDDVPQEERNRETFQWAVHKYTTRHDKYKRGSVEFIYASMAHMKEFGVHRDLPTYKQILSIMPKTKMVAKTAWQVEMMHYPKQQQCAIDLMDEMEMNGVVPDDQFGYLLKDMFGTSTHTFRKYQRMMYWMPKFKHVNPYPVPYNLPTDPIALARLALGRMAVDPQNKISDFETSQLPGDDMLDATFVVSAQSPGQSELLADHDTQKPVFVEGGFTVWLRQQSLTYFVLKSDTTETYKVHAQQEKVHLDEFRYFEDFLQEIPFFSEKAADIVKQPSVHEQDDGTVLAMCITGTGSKNSLATWVKWLQRANPRLAQVPVIFRLATPETGLMVIKGEADRLRELASEELL